MPTPKSAKEAQKPAREKDQGRVVCYLDDDSLAILEARAGRLGVSKNLLAKRMIEEGIKQDPEPLLAALNFLAEHVSDLKDSSEEFEKNVRREFQQLGKLLVEVLNQIQIEPSTTKRERGD